MRQPIHVPYEISPEVTKRISWLRRRLLRWFARNGRSFPWRESGRSPTRSSWRRSCCRGRQRLRSLVLTMGSSSFTLLDGPRSIALGGARECAQTPRALASEGAVIPAASTDDRDEWLRRTRTHKELERLPGIGPYTASAMLAIVYGSAEPLGDVNVGRLLGRFLGVPEGIEVAKPSGTEI